ncbi:hypothetical protein CDL15_Pgr010807 [Punica granatum]|uniref:Uncharacterized protein n=1 Tax=Punica granatum TaxID=22663 RepID=A0A218W5S9_PUNGR|nr:hypothetical protein CDL15_Pgr010807 [Punica granatum]PKI78099.1 hypothetical protein CRG98_001427 [Punica granatum]
MRELCAVISLLLPSRRASLAQLPSELLSSSFAPSCPCGPAAQTPSGPPPALLPRAATPAPVAHVAAVTVSRSLSYCPLPPSTNRDSPKL